MVTLNQIIKFSLRRKKRGIKIKKIKRKALNKCPQKKGICVWVAKMSPKKPNSASRSITKVGLVSTLDQVLAYIPWERHNLTKYSNILVQGGRARDLPGIQYKVIRGKFDLEGVKGSRKRRSRKGTRLGKIKDRIRYRIATRKRNRFLQR